MKREFRSIGSMPEKLSESMGFEMVFRTISEKIIENFNSIIEVSYPEHDYPISHYSTENETGCQIALESDVFTTDMVILRKNYSGYVIIATSEGDCDGVFEFEFPEDDPLTNLLSLKLITKLNSSLNEF